MQYRILVVDDLQVNLDSTRLLLSRWGYEVDTAQNGAEALEKIANPANEYALILLDYKMPGKDGATVAREIRWEARHTPKTVHLKLGIKTGILKAVVLKKNALRRNPNCDLRARHLNPRVFLKTFSFGG